MARKYLTLGPPEDVTKALVLSPLAAIATLWLCFAASNAGMLHLGIVLDLAVLPAFLAFGVLFGAILEVIVVVPLVARFRRYRWRWVNMTAVVIIGVLTGMLPMVGLTALSPSGFSGLMETDAALALAAFGLAGAAGAVTFGRIAARPAGG